MTALERWIAKLEMRDRPNRLGALEGMRGLAIVLVFLVHYWTLFGFLLPAGSGTDAAGRFLEPIGQCGVDLFFLLSGYLIQGLLTRPGTGAAAFLKRRARRIYPVFLSVFALYVALSVALPERSKIPAGSEAGIRYLAANILLLPGIFDIPPLIRVSWSLSYEVLFYMSAPLLFAAAGLRRRREARGVWIAAVAAGYWIACLAGSSLYWKAIVLAPLGHPRLILFAAGMLIREYGPGWEKKIRGRDGVAGALFALGTLSVCLLAAIQHDGLRNCLHALVLTVCYGYFLLTAAHGDGWVRRRLAARSWRLLGNVSYSYYLIHGLVLHSLTAVVLRLDIAGGASVYWVLMLPAFAATVGAAMLLFLLVERPFSFTALTESQTNKA